MYSNDQLSLIIGTASGPGGNHFHSNWHIVRPGAADIALQFDESALRSPGNMSLHCNGWTVSTWPIQIDSEVLVLFQVSPYISSKTGVCGNVLLLAFGAFKQNEFDRQSLLLCKCG